MGILQGFLPGSDPDTPNTFIQAPQQLTYQQQLAQELMREGSSSAPIASPWQGAAQLAKALMGGMQMGKVQSEQRLATANATADTSNVLNQRGLGNDPGEQIIPATPGQTTPALQANDAANDAITDAEAGGANPRAALAAALAASGGGSAPALSPNRTALANAITNSGQPASNPDPMAIAAAMGGGTPYGTSNVNGSGILAGVNGSSRGMRNNNPGNLESNAWTQGLPGYAGTDGRFAIFDTPQAGAAALDRNLAGYGAKGIATPLAIASTWAPGSEAGNNPNSYGAAIARTLGVGLNDQVNMSDPATRAKIGQAIALVENGPGQASTSPAVAAINAATGANSGAPPAASAYAPVAPSQAVPSPATTQFSGVDRLSPDAAASPLARPSVPSAPTPPPSAGDLGKLGAAMTTPTPNVGVMSGHPVETPAKAISPSDASPAPNLMQGGDISGLLRIMSNPWASPGEQQIAQTLMQQQLPTPLAFEKIGVDPNTGKDLYGSRNPRTGQIAPYFPPANPAAPTSSTVPTPPPGVDPDQWRKDMATRQAATVAPSIAEKQAFASHLLDRPSYKELSASLPTANSLPDLARENSPAGDTGLIDGVAKILNPGLAVRQGTYAIFQDEQGGLNKFKGEVDKVLHQGAVLQPDTRAQLMRVANEKMQQYKSAWDADVAQQSKIATKGGMDPAEVIPQLPALAPLNLTSISSEKTQAYPVAAPAQTPPAPGARQAPDGNWYTPDPARPGKYLMVH